MFHAFLAGHGPPANTDVLDWFKQQGPGYQTRINAVLRAFVQQAGKRRP